MEKDNSNIRKFGTELTRIMSILTGLIFSIFATSWLGFSKNSDKFAENLPYYSIKLLTFVFFYFLSYKLFKWLYTAYET